MKESKDQKKSLTHLEKKIDIYEEYEEDIKELTLSLEDKVAIFYSYYLHFRSKPLIYLHGLHWQLYLFLFGRLLFLSKCFL